MMRAFITGITGQDGSYLAGLLLDKGYEVHGLVRSASPGDPALDGVHLHHGDMTDGARLTDIVRDLHPDEVYNLAAQSHVQLSFEEPEDTASTDGIGPVLLLEALRAFAPEARFYQASSSEMFGASPPPQHENTPFAPRSPYGAAKLHAHWATITHRDAYGMFAVSGILFNHESPRRAETFVTRKITMAVARIKHGLQREVHLGNLDAVRDWGFAPEYVDGMWRMLQQDTPDTFVLGTGIGTTVREFCETAFSHAGLDWREHVRSVDDYERPNEPDALVADPSKANDVLDWKAETDAKQLARLMVDADLALVQASLA
jgi:GDPmannose 4,6-dehydratase